MADIAFKQGRAFTLEDDYAPIINGEIPLPNRKDIDPLLFLTNLASGGHSLMPKWGWAKIDGHKAWTQFFLTPAGMGGRFDGGGYAVTYRNGKWDAAAKKMIPDPIVSRFTICEHEKIDGFGANHQRGWHPGSCKHCGLDMTVDSGD